MKGRLVIERLIEEGRLDMVAPDRNVVGRQLHYADQNLAAARELIGRYPLPAFTSAYDSARLTATALLEQQGLRARVDGGHLTIEEAVSAQIGEAVGRRFRAIRLLRHASEYPAPDREGADESDATEAVRFAEHLRAAAELLLQQMGVFELPDQ